MSGQTVRNHRDRPTVNAGPSGSGIQAGLHKLSQLYFFVIESFSDDISDKNSSDSDGPTSDVPQEDDDLEGHERPTKRARRQGKLPVVRQYILVATVYFLQDIY